MIRCRHCGKIHGRPYCCGCSYGASYGGGFCPSLDEIVNGYFECHGCKIEPERMTKNQRDALEEVRAHDAAI